MIVFDHHQIDIKLAKNLEQPLCSDDANAQSEMRKADAFRRKMVSYFENQLKNLSLEIRFLELEIEPIMRLKQHPLIKDINSHSKASIRVIICCHEVG